MQYVVIAIAIILAVATGCGGSSGNSEFEHHQPRSTTDNNDPAHAPVEGLPELEEPFGSPVQYGFDDFWLDEDVVYWELRTGTPSGDDSSESAWSYDDQQRESLSSEQLASLDVAPPAQGFQTGCQPDSCVVFAVAVTQSGTEILSSHADFLAFLSPINSEAKLNMWLWANDYQGHSYQVVESGYEAVVHKADPLCVEDQFYKVFVDTNGVITETRTLMTRAPMACP